MSTTRSKHPITVAKNLAKPIEADPIKVAKIRDKFKGGSIYYPRSTIMNGFQKAFELEKAKHKDLPVKRLAQEILGKNAYQFIDTRPITHEEYDEILQTMNNGENKIPNIKIKYEEFKALVPIVTKEMPHNAFKMTQILKDWAQARKRLVELQVVAKESQHRYNEKEASCELASKHGLSKAAKRRLLDEKIQAHAALQRANANCAQQNRELLKFELFGMSADSFSENYNFTYKKIAGALQHIFQKKHDVLEKNTTLNELNKNLIDAEKHFTDTTKALNNSSLLSIQLLPLILHQRVLAEFEGRKNKAFVGTLLNIIKFIVDEYNGNKDAAAGLSMLMGGSTLYRLLHQVLANLKLQDDKESRLYKHPFITERGQQECLNLWRKEVIKHEECNIRLMTSLPNDLNHYLGDYIYVRTNSESHLFYVKKEEAQANSENLNAQKIIAQEVSFPLDGNSEVSSKKVEFEKRLAELMGNNVYLHLHQASVKKLFNAKTIERCHGQQLFKNIPFISGANNRFYDAQRILDSIAHPTNHFKPKDTTKAFIDPFKQEAFNKNGIPKYPKVIKTSKNINDYIDNKLVQNQAYKKMSAGKYKARFGANGEVHQQLVKPGHWELNGFQMNETKPLIEKLMKRYNKYMTDFKNIPTHSTTYKTNQPPVTTSATLRRNFLELEKLREGFEKESQMVAPPTNLVPPEKRHNMRNLIVNFDHSKLKSAKDRTLLPKQFPRDGKALEMWKDKYKVSYAATMKQIAVLKSYPEGHAKEFQAMVDPKLKEKARKYAETTNVTAPRRMKK